MGHSRPPDVDRPDWPHFADAMITYRGGVAQRPRAVRASALGGPGAGYIRSGSGRGASLGLGRRTAEVTPGCGSTSGGPEAGLLSCLQGPALQTKWPAAPRTELAPGCRDSTPEACGLPGPAPLNRGPAAPRTELPPGCGSTSRTGQRGPATPDLVSCRPQDRAATAGTARPAQLC